jgi:hypothetical protein
MPPPPFSHLLPPSSFPLPPFSPPKTLLIDGANLCHIDGVPDTVYEPSGTYVVFPASASFFGRQSTGHVLLRNKSAYTLLLTSQMRRSALTDHAHTVLPAGQRLAFDYCGEWVIRVHVDPPTRALLLRTLTDVRELISVERCSTTRSGGDGDLLAMCE